MCGPTGIGVLYGKQELLEAMEPVEFGGEMIDLVNLYDSTWKELPWKFEGGTPIIAGAVGLGAAIDFLNEVGLESITEYEDQLIHYGMERLAEIEGLKIYGPEKRAGLITFIICEKHQQYVSKDFDCISNTVCCGNTCSES